MCVAIYIYTYVCTYGMSRHIHVFITKLSGHKGLCCSDATSSSRSSWRGRRRGPQVALPTSHTVDVH